MPAKFTGSPSVFASKTEERAASSSEKRRKTGFGGERWDMTAPPKIKTPEPEREKPTEPKKPEEPTEPKQPEAQRNGDEEGQPGHCAALPRRSELPTTTSELSDMATAAISGVTRPEIASGTARIL